MESLLKAVELSRLLPEGTLPTHTDFYNFRTSLKVGSFRSNALPPIFPMPHKLKRSSEDEFLAPTKRPAKTSSPNSAMAISTLLSPTYLPEPSSDLNHLPSLTNSPPSHFHQFGTLSSLERSRASPTSFYRPPFTSFQQSRSIFPEPDFTTYNNTRKSTQNHIKTILTSNAASSLLDTDVTTIQCYHSSVAQKSYGSEKRFICPPPIVRVVSNKGTLKKGSPVSSLCNSVSISIVCDPNGPILEQKAQLNSSPTVFRYLHVAGTNKAKNFKLRLDLFNSLGHTKSTPAMSFESSPIAIISKPSKKCIKSRSLTSCLFSGSSVALYSRINSQTVRTNYLTVNDQSALTFSKTEWSPFIINLVFDGEEQGVMNALNTNGHPPFPNSSATPLPQSTQPISYGSIVTLTDTDSGLISEPFVVCKVDRGEAILNAKGHVSQMNKVALRKVGSGSSFLSSALGSLPLTDPSCQNSSFDLKASVAFSSLTLDSESAQLDDRETWTIVSISKFEQTLDPSESHAALDSLSMFPYFISKPRLLHDSKLELILSPSFELEQLKGLEIWAGTTGPLSYQLSSAFPGQPRIVTLSLSNPDMASLEMADVTGNSQSIELPLIVSDNQGRLLRTNQIIYLNRNQETNMKACSLFTYST